VKELKIICLTFNGLQKAVQVAEKWSDPCQIYIYNKTLNQKLNVPVFPFNSPLSALLTDLWKEGNNILFIGALGILVRSFAGLLKTKYADPAIIAMDEKGQYVISVLSGHWGGANELARDLAQKLGSQHVITTATDVWGKTGIDILAKKWRLIPEPYEAIKTINTMIINDQQLTIYTDHDISNLLADFHETIAVWSIKSINNLLLQSDQQDLPCVAITNKARDQFPASWLLLRPPTLIIGIGCRKGTSAAAIRTAIEGALKQAQKSILSVKCLASAEIKRFEPGLHEVANSMSVSCIYHQKEDLNAYAKTHPNINISATAWKRRGIMAVCEPAAMISGDSPRLIIPKMNYPNVTVAIAEEDWP
jgi:cobalt-precorrin 5A hydrolase